MTGCGCVLLIAAMVGLIIFLIFGSTDPGEPIESAVALSMLLLFGELATRRAEGSAPRASRST